MLSRYHAGAVEIGFVSIVYLSRLSAYIVVHVAAFVIERIWKNTNVVYCNIEYSVRIRHWDKVVYSNMISNPDRWCGNTKYTSVDGSACKFMNAYVVYCIRQPDHQANS